MFRKVDCVLLRVPDLEAALSFYRDGLGLEPAWRRGHDSAGLRMDSSDTELVLAQESGAPETDLLVDSVDSACRVFQQAGGKVVKPPFDITIGKCAVLRDPWGNPLVILDMTKGPLRTDQEGTVIE
jgi:lactoylglutathione lyase